ncbi:unnamed protein product [Cuscuta campestris]|uniref:Protein FAR1-RELATED SEQUENCE n=1 Tax=Cuscuta campestris TaxID=132261 RepID=A0A484MCB4_9ASTE|nr:unnamed protein product [Cuscuta campestris]
MEEDIDASPRAPIPGIGSTPGDSSAPKKTKGRSFREEAAEAEHSARLSARFDSLVSHGDPGSERYLLNDDVLVESSGGCSTEGHNVPVVGMKFSSIEEIRGHYLAYARSVGFPIRTRTTRKSAEGTIRSVTFVCCREGSKKRKTQNVLHPKPMMQLGCEARVTASCDGDGVWRISVVQLVHNHSFSHIKSRLYRCNRNSPAYVKKKIEVDAMPETSLHKSFQSAIVQAGGYEQVGLLENDCRNYVEEGRRLRFSAGDAMAIQSYFNRMQVKNNGFFFSLDFDEESRLRNVFWADNRCRRCYTYFGDVITFDTTYLTNKYDTPLVSFVGVNHHGQSILLGCGLILQEDTDSFVWLFKTWLQCMDGIPPQGIITDQNRAVENAISIVFPHTKHRWCLWHILKKLPEKLEGMLATTHIMANIHELVYDVHVINEFELRWKEMIENMGLHDHTWLGDMYAARARWVPCFLQKSFWAGMSTAQPNESINAFFDGYVHAKTTLKQFVVQYERALRKKVEMELQADASSFAKMIPCLTTYEMEKQVQEVYTLCKFKEFQTELFGKVYCDIVSTVGGSVYEVEDVCINGLDMKKSFQVLFDSRTKEVECTCHLFEFRGTICRHCIVVLIRNDVSFLPEKYILHRWRRDVQRAYTRVKIDYDGWVCTVQQQRYDDLCKNFQVLANMVVDDEERTNEIMEWMERELASRVGRTQIPTTAIEQVSESTLADPLHNLDPE